MVGPCTLWFIWLTRGFRDGQGGKDECVVPIDVRDARSWACPVAPGVVVPSGMIFRRVRARVTALRDLSAGRWVCAKSIADGQNCRSSAESGLLSEKIFLRVATRNLPSEDTYG